MAFSLSYDPNQDPEVQDNINQQEQEALELGEKLAEEENQLLAGKYQSAAELEAAYLELQSAFTKKQQQQTEQKDEGEEEIDLEALLPDLREEFNQYGQLTQETAEYLGEELAQQVEQALEAEGDDTDGVALSAEETSQVQQLVGGAEAYREMVEWSAENLPEAEQEAYNRVIDNGDLNAIYWAVKGLQARYTDAVGNEGPLLRGKAPSSRGEVFRSMAELVRAQSDPRYDNDPAYRQDILQKLERSGDLL
jgi:hypothetical protein